MPALKLLVTGAQGQLGRSFSWLLQQAPCHGVEVQLLGRGDLDITDKAQIDHCFAQYRPDVVINTAAYTAVDKAESEPESVMKVNALAPRLLAEACSQSSARLIHVSTDYVFSGSARQPYAEEAVTGPINVYGASKREGELAVLTTCPDSVVLRTSWVFSQFGNNFLKTMLRVGQSAPQLRIVADQFGGPTYAPHIAQVLLQLARRMHPEDGTPNEWVQPRGVFHFAGQPSVSWYAFAEEIFRQALELAGSGVPQLVSALLPIPSSEYPTPAARPRNSVLQQQRLDNLSGMGVIERDWRQGVRSSLLALAR